MFDEIALGGARRARPEHRNRKNGVRWAKAAPTDLLGHHLWSAVPTLYGRAKPKQKRTNGVGAAERMLRRDGNVLGRLCPPYEAVRNHCALRHHTRF